MELTDEELYATAALFTLAVYCTTFEAGVTCATDTGGWGVPFEEVCNAYSNPDKARELQGWGWQLVAPAGICGRVFRGLSIRSSAMPGLIAITDPVHPLTSDERKATLTRLVDAYARRLDPDLVFSQQASAAAVLSVADAPSAGGIAIGERAAALSGCSSVKSLTALDTPLDDAGAAVRPIALAPELVPEARCDAAAAPAAAAASGAVPPLDDDAAFEASLRASLMQLVQSPGSREERDALNLRLEAMRLTEGAILPQRAFAPAPMYAHKSSSKSIAALAQVLGACICHHRAAAAAGAPPAPALAPRWYDARARVACHRLAHWLCVPSGTVCALEAHAMVQAGDAVLEPGAASSWRSYYSKSSKWIKVGAAAVGGATLMAVTAGLAAPAIIAGVGTAVGMTASAGAGAAIAGAATTAPAVGIVSGGMGAAGAAHFSSKMAWRTADVKAMGFVRLSAWDLWQRERALPEGDPPSTAAGAAAPPDATAQPAASSPSFAQRTARASPAGGPGSSSSAQEAREEAEAARPLLGPCSHGGEEPAQPSSSPPCGAAAERPAGSPSRGGAWSSWGKKRAQSAVAGLADPLRSPLPTPLMDVESSDQAGILIAINGSIRSIEDFVAPWGSLPRKSGDAYALIWEKGPLVEVGQAFVKLLAKNGAQLATQWALSTTVLTSGLVAAMAWPIGVLSAASLIDSAWDVASNRATLAGQLLAHMLIARVHGDRPVTLVGVSLGARLVYYCCLELYKQGAMGILEHVVLLGTPVSVNADRWCLVRAVVAGRVINGYSPLDWALALMYRSSITGQGLIKRVAGLSPANVPGVEDVDLSDIVKGHADYLKSMDQILKAIDFCHENEQAFPSGPGSKP